MVDLTIRELQRLAHENAVNKGFWESPTCWDCGAEQKRNIPEQLALIQSEISEALEEYRNPDRKITETYYRGDDGKVEGFPSELCDAMIRIADVAEAYGIDLTKTLNEKMEYNKSRPYRHGNKKA